MNEIISENNRSVRQNLNLNYDDLILALYDQPTIK